MNIALSLPPAPEHALPGVSHEHDLLGMALAGVVGRALAQGRRPLIRGLPEADFDKLVQAFFVDGELGTAAAQRNAEQDCAAIDQFDAFEEFDEFDDLVALLLAHRAEPSEELAWLSFAMASAAMGENHLWQDMGLPSRDALSALIARYYPALHAANRANMKWKKFFYRQLCASAGVPICKSPHCADCCDYAICFGPEN